MSLRVYNTLTKQKDLFEPVRPGKVGIYLCGPTVYKSPHIGHMVGPVIFDAVKRYLKYKGFEVTWVVNITDVDDKLIDAANRLNTTVEALAEKHTKVYFEALAALGVDGIDHFPKATDHIPEIIKICQDLVSTGHAYAVEGNVWFDVAKDPDYGKLSHRKVEEQEAGTRNLEGGGKRSPADFALWKSAKPGEPMWDSPWGKGRPGWHIECSAMSMKILGPTFDIHGGGMDLMFPHHENELAQSESATGQTFVKYWLHNGLTKIRTKEGPNAAGGAEDIHETTGNAAQVRALDLIAKHGPEVIRYLLLSSHYRSPIEFSDSAMASAKKASAVFARLFERIDRILGEPLGDGATDMDRIASSLLESDHASYAKNVLGLKLKFLEMMDDDFNTAGAIGALHEMAGEINAFIERNDLDRSKHDDLADAAAAGVQTLRRLGQVLGLFMHRPAAPAANDALPGQLMELIIRLRQDARAKKNFELADAIRKGLTVLGITIEDGPDGTRWRKD
jgi:cysteinyl-tRNA synthetase